MFCTPVTADEMKEQSRIATEEGMRAFAEALIKKEEEEENSSDGDETPNWSKSKEAATVDKLEGRIHILTLEAVNAKVAMEDAIKETGEVKARLNPYIRANNELALIHSARERASKGGDTLTTQQFKQKIEIFDEEAREHFALCGAAISRIELAEVKNALERVLASERRRVLSQKDKLKMVLIYRQMWKIGKIACMFYGVMCVLLSFYRIVF
jgi:hypothetical protein